MALESLKAYIQNILLAKKTSAWMFQLENILRLISPLVEGLSQAPTLLDPAQTPGGPGGWIAATAGYLQLRLLEIYTLIPFGINHLGDLEVLLKICSKPVRGSTTLSSLSGTPLLRQIGCTLHVYTIILGILMCQRDVGLPCVY